jgi:hypothetical protein
MSGTYPTATYLHRIGKVQSNICPYCTTGSAETLGHFACVCPKFRAARTAAHNKAWSTISSFVASKADKQWKFHWDVPMTRTALILSSVLLEEQQEDCELLGQPPARVRVDSLRPDGVAVSEVSKKIGILEFCRPSDSHPGQLEAAYARKNLRYAVIGKSLCHYVQSGWQVKIFPWVVGIRGLVEEGGIHSALEYLGIPRTEWSTAVSCTVVASVESFAFMHRVRYASTSQNGVFDTDDPVAFAKDTANKTCSRKRQFSATASGPQETQARWKRMAFHPGRPQQ